MRAENSEQSNETSSQVISQLDVADLPEQVEIGANSVLTNNLVGQHIDNLKLVKKAMLKGKGYNSNIFASDSEGNHLVTGKEYWFSNPKVGVRLGDVWTISTKNRVIGEKGNPDRPDRYKIYLKDLPDKEGIKLEYGDAVYFK